MWIIYIDGHGNWLKMKKKESVRDEGSSLERILLETSLNRLKMSERRHRAAIYKTTDPPHSAPPLLWNCTVIPDWTECQNIVMLVYLLPDKYTAGLYDIIYKILHFKSFQKWCWCKCKEKPVTETETEWVHHKYTHIHSIYLHLEFSFWARAADSTAAARQWDNTGLRGRPGPTSSLGLICINSFDIPTLHCVMSTSVNAWWVIRTACHRIRVCSAG